MPAHLSEDELIARFFAPLAGPAGLGLADDVALIKPPAGCDLVATADALVAGVHFFPDDPPGAVPVEMLLLSYPVLHLASRGRVPPG